MRQDKMKTAFDKAFAPMEFTKRHQLEVLNALNHKKPRLNKRRVSLALAMGLSLVVLAAIAMTTLRDTGRFMAQIEQKQGEYIHWEPSKKAKLVRDLVSQGYIEDTEELKRLTSKDVDAKEAERIADAAIAAFIGEGAEGANFLSIMQAAWGEFTTWSAEEQAWYSELMQQVGNNQEGKTLYTKPQKGPVSRVDAINIAKQEVIRVFGIQKEVMDKLRVETSFHIPENAAPGDRQSYWYVAFDSWNTGLKKEDLPFAGIDMFVHPDTGELRTPLEEYKAMLDAEAARRNTPVAKAIRAFSEQYQEPKVFWTWELEAKAAFSREIAPMIRAFVQEHPDKADWPFNSYMKIASEFDYGLPGEGVISQEQALALARVALVQEYGLSEDQAKIIADHPVNVFFVNLFYDVTNPDKPLWKVFYSSPSIYVQDQGLVALIKKTYGEGDIPNYKVELDAKTGEVVRVFTMQYSPSTEEEKRAIL